MRDRGLESAAVAAGVAAACDLHRCLALERHDRLAIAHERHCERAARERLSGIATATAAPTRRGRRRERDVLDRGASVRDVELVDGAGLQVGDERACTVGRDRQAARLVAEVRAPTFAMRRRVVRDERAIGDRRDQHALAIRRQRDAERLDRRLDRSGQLELRADLDDRDAIRRAIRDVRELRDRIVGEHAGIRADAQRGDVRAAAIGAHEVAAVGVDHERAVVERGDARCRQVCSGRVRWLAAADRSPEERERLRGDGGR